MWISKGIDGSPMVLMPRFRDKSWNLGIIDRFVIVFLLGELYHHWVTMKKKKKLDFVALNLSFISLKRGTWSIGQVLGEYFPS